MEGRAAASMVQGEARRRSGAVRTGRASPADGGGHWNGKAELRIGRQTREEYDHVDAALEMRRGYEMLRKRGLGDAQAKGEIAKALRGTTPKGVGFALKFLEVADLFLEAMGKKSRYAFLQGASGGGGREAALILQDVSVQREKLRKAGLPPGLLARWFTASCLFAKFAGEGAAGAKGGTRRAPPFTRIEYRRFSTKVMGDDQIRERFLGLGLLESASVVRTSDAGDARDLFDAIRLCESEFDAKCSIASPLGHVEKAMHALAKVSGDLQGAHKAEKIRALRDNRGREHVADIMALAEGILKKLG